MLPGEQAEMQARYIVLLEVTEEAPGEAPWTFISKVGVMVVPHGTKRSTVVARLLAAQGETRTDVPQLPLSPGQEGMVYVVAEGDLGDALAVVARHRLVVEPAAVTP